MDEVRQKGGRKAVILAISANCFLTVANILVGIYSGSYALVSEGAHTISDIATSIIAYGGFHFGQKPADEDHPVGHGRAEAISGLVIVIFLIIIGWEILHGAVERIINPTLITVPDTYAAIMATVGIIVNLAVSSRIIEIGKEIKSPAIVADGQHQRTDIFSSIAILVGVVVSNIGFPILDPIIAVVISGLIFKTAIEVLIENVNNIMGKVPSPEFINEIKKVANSTNKAQNAHNIRVDYFGSYATVTLHMELDGKLTLNETHKIAHEVESNIVKNIPEIKFVTVHTCPIGSHYNHEQELDK